MQEKLKPFFLAVETQKINQLSSLQLNVWNTANLDSFFFFSNRAGQT